MALGRMAARVLLLPLRLSCCLLGGVLVALSGCSKPVPSGWLRGPAASARNPLCSSFTAELSSYTELALFSEDTVLVWVVLTRMHS